MSAASSGANGELSGKMKRLVQQLRGLEIVPGVDALRLALVRLAGLQEALDSNAVGHADLLEKVERLTKGVLKRFRQGQTSSSQDEDELVELARVVDEISSWLNEVQKNGPARSVIHSDRNSKQLERYNKLLDDIISQAQLDVTLEIRKALKTLHVSKDASRAILVIPNDLPLVELPPNPYPTFVKGRHEQRNYIRQALLRSPSSPVAVLGGGGMGKTTFAVTLLHDEAVTAEFGRNRIFVSCDGLTTAEGIVAFMLTLVPVSAPEGITPLQALVVYLQSLKPRVLVVLDNLESAWDTLRREAVEMLLTTLCNVSTLALVITMRGTQAPNGQRWLSFDPLQKLSLEDARDLFIDISGVHDDKLDDLLGHLDGIPLAVTLMGSLGRITGNTPSKLLQSYLTESTSMVGTGASTRLSSLEVSIMVSINCRTMQQNSEALELLRFLSLLPDGVRDGDLEIVFPHMKRRQGAARILCAVALTTYVDDVLRVLAPIRDFMQTKYPPTGSHLVGMQNYYIHLSSSSKAYPNVPRALVETLSYQIANLQSVLMHALRAPTDPVTLLDAIISISGFSCRAHVGDCTTMLRAVMSLYPTHAPRGETRRRVPSVISKLLHPLVQRTPHSDSELRHKSVHCSLNLGVTLSNRYQYAEATQVLNETKIAYTDIGDGKGVAKCLWYCADILQMRGEYDQAVDVFSEAELASSSIGDRAGVAMCLRSLGDVLRHQGKHAQAVDLFIKARAMYKDLGDLRGNAECLSGLAKIKRLYGEYEEAARLLDEAKAAYMDLGDRLGVAECLWNLGEILRMRGEYDEAFDVLKTGKAAFGAIGNRRGLAKCLWSLGETLRLQSRDDQAEDMLNEAKAIWTDIGDRLGLANCGISLAETRQAQGDLNGARVLFSEARDLYEGLILTTNARWCEEQLHLLSHPRAQQEQERGAQTELRRSLRE